MYNNTELFDHEYSLALTLANMNAVMDGIGNLKWLCSGSFVLKAARQKATMGKTFVNVEGYSCPKSSNITRFSICFLDIIEYRLILVSVDDVLYNCNTT